LLVSVKHLITYKNPTHSITSIPLHSSWPKTACARRGPANHSFIKSLCTDCDVLRYPCSDISGIDIERRREGRGGEGVFTGEVRQCGDDGRGDERIVEGGEDGEKRSVCKICRVGHISWLFSCVSINYLFTES
jgi:hypothetical protein